MPGSLRLILPGKTRTSPAEPATPRPFKPQVPHQIFPYLACVVLPSQVVPNLVPSCHLFTYQATPRLPRLNSPDPLSPHPPNPCRSRPRLPCLVRPRRSNCAWPRLVFLPLPQNSLGRCIPGHVFPGPAHAGRAPSRLPCASRLCASWLASIRLTVPAMPYRVASCQSHLDRPDTTVRHPAAPAVSVVP